ncbi:MAG: type II toxin-antitoxin system RelE/ParE family toxin [Caldithrix sp.]|nr:MAG: type II toxin-antitoxin system RelE/ParE family toxin [Caldithrix sp.]
MRVVWTQEALDRLFDIEDFISQNSPQRAVRFINYLMQRGEGLSKNPLIGRIVPEISSPNIREIIVKKHRIIYKIQENKIEILTVFEGHKLLSLEELRAG